MTKRTQVAIFIAMLFSLIAGTRAEDASRYTRQLTSECDLICLRAVNRPYGKALVDDQAVLGKNNAARPVALGRMETATAAFVLYQAGLYLNNPKYRQTAIDMAHGIAAAQATTGQIPSRALFGNAVSATDVPVAVPDRSTTCAALGLFLTILDNEPNRDDRLFRAATHATLWLSKQQTTAGGWPIVDPPDASPKDATRFLRLDTNACRDPILALLLSREVLKSDMIGKLAVQRSLEQLLKLRVYEGVKLGKGLWMGAYNLDGSRTDHFRDLANNIDLLSTRNAIQILMAYQLTLNDKDSVAAVDAATKTVASLRRPDAGFDRFLLIGDATLPTTRPAPVEPGVFTPRPDSRKTASANLYDLGDLLRSVSEMKMMGREKYRASLTKGFPYRQQLAQVLVGLSDTPFANDWPTSADDVKLYVKEHSSDWRELDTGIPTSLPERVQRLWTLYLRARLEQMGG